MRNETRYPRKGAANRLVPAVLGLTLGLALAPTLAFAQDFERVAPQEPPAGEEGGLELPSPPEAAPETGADKAILPELKGIVVRTAPGAVAKAGVPTKGVDVSALSGADAAALDKVLQPFIGQPLRQRDLAAISRAVIAAFRSEGKPLVDVTFPPQDVTSGTVQLLVMEFHLGKIGVSGNKWFDASQYRDGLAQKQGKPIDVDRLKRGLSQLNANPFRQVSAVLKPGASLGETDIGLQVRDRFPLRVYVSYDNTGLRATGRDRWSAGFNWGNAFWAGHRLSYQFTTSGDLLKSRDRGPGLPDDPRFMAHALTYTVPLPWLDTLEVFGSYDRQVPDIGPFFGQVGESWQASLRYRHDLPSLDWVNQSVMAGFDYKSSNNDLAFGGVQIFASRTEVDQFLLGYDLTAADDWGQTSFNNTLYLSPGGMSSDNTDSAYAAAGQADADAHYVYNSATVTRVTGLPKGASWVVRLKGQVADGNLPASEKLGAGGTDSVRGYEVRALNRSEGLLLSNELRSPSFRLLGRAVNGIEDQGQLVAFWDYAWLVDADEVAGTSQQAAIQGAGVGARYVLDRYLSMRFDMGWQLRRLPGASERGARGAISITLSY
ncbi:hemolysin activation/secretion protein [Parvibaculum sp. MBR-TMA-1.3b-4.2]